MEIAIYRKTLITVRIDEKSYVPRNLTGIICTIFVHSV